jgi:sulfatase maturation enzyme AslB (radical SAM superfamily)
MTQNEKFKKPDDILNLQLIITEQCNLRCRYCFEINKGSRQMPLELAKEILKKELSIEDSPNECLIDLVGGEPLLRFDEVKELIEYCISNAQKIPFFNRYKSYTLKPRDGTMV